VYNLAAGITSIINALDPEVIIIGGGIAQAGPALFDPLERFLEKVEWQPQGQRVRIIPAVLGDFAWRGLLCNELRRGRLGAQPMKVPPVFQVVAVSESSAT